MNMRVRDVNLPTRPTWIVITKLFLLLLLLLLLLLSLLYNYPEVNI